MATYSSWKFRSVFAAVESPAAKPSELALTWVQSGPILTLTELVRQTKDALTSCCAKPQSMTAREALASPLWSASPSGIGWMTEAERILLNSDSALSL